MSEKVSRIVRKLKSIVPAMKGLAHISFSQFGEDLILQSMLKRSGINELTYLDIGANEPIIGNNTYGFYLAGNRGVLIEPNFDLCQKIKKVRPRDTVLNFGIGGDVESHAEYYMFGKDNSPLNTFSKQDALNYEKEGFRVHKIVDIPLKNVNSIIKDYFADKSPTVISLDVEGLDEIILKSLDFDKYQPLLFCVETAIFGNELSYKKRKGLFELMKEKNYSVYADTHVNTIFCPSNILIEP